MAYNTAGDILGCRRHPFIGCGHIAQHASFAETANSLGEFRQKAAKACLDRWALEAITGERVGHVDNAPWASHSEFDGIDGRGQGGIGGPVPVR